MKKFTVKANNYLQMETKGYYNCEYVGYQKSGNPDFINHLKNMSKKSNELDLVHDFMEVFERSNKDIKEIIEKENFSNCVVIVIPRSKSENSYSQSQLLFKKAISCVADQIGVKNGTHAIKRVKDSKTTHSWRMENNMGDMPYEGITKETCTIDANAFSGINVILVDDIYTEGVNVAEDCIQTLLDFGAKNVILYVIAKTRK